MVPSDSQIGSFWKAPVKHPARDCLQSPTRMEALPHSSSMATGRLSPVDTSRRLCLEHSYFVHFLCVCACAHTHICVYMWVFTHMCRRVCVGQRLMYVFLNPSLPYHFKDFKALIYSFINYKYEGLNVSQYCCGSQRTTRE